MTSTTVDLADVYRRAAEVIRTNGHCKNWFYDLYSEGTVPRRRCRVCAVGALSLALTGDPQPAEDLPQDLADALRALAARVPSDVVDTDAIERIADWNDHPSRTADDVIAEFLAAAEEVSA